MGVQSPGNATRIWSRPARNDAGHASLWSDPEGPLTISSASNQGRPCFRLSHEDLIDVDVFDDGSIIVAADQATPQNTIDHFIADQVVPRLLSHQGQMVVHAATVRIDDAAILLLGQSGRGKSTLGASFDQSGFSLLGDDAGVVESFGGEPVVRAMYQTLRLLPDSFETILPDDTPSTEVAHYSTKRLVDLSAREGSSEAFPLLAVFLLEPPDDGGISLQRLGRADSCMSLVANSFALDPTDTGRLARKLADASPTAIGVPFFALSFPRDFALLPDVRAAIIDVVMKDRK